MIWRSFEEARIFVRSLGLNTKGEWQEYCKSGERPKDIPSNPWFTYKNDGWISNGDWIGKMQFRSFKEAREFVHSLKIKNRKEWWQYCKSGKKPADIPKSPEHAYKNKGWKSWGDWNGTDIIRRRTESNTRSFKEAREFVHSLKLKRLKDWQEYCKSGKRPNDISSHPDTTHKKEWKGWGDWLGTGKMIHLTKSNTRPFEEAREFARSLGLKGGYDEWFDYAKSGKKPVDIPYEPHIVYKNKGWNGLSDWLGAGMIGKYTKDNTRPYNEAREFVCSLNLKNVDEWNQYCKSGKKPDDIPKAVHQTYKKDWKGYGDWLGTGTISSQERSKNFPPLIEAKIEARKIAKELGLKTDKDWIEAYRAGKIPKNLPASPSGTYGNKKRKK